MLKNCYTFAIITLLKKSLLESVIANKLKVGE